VLLDELVVVEVVVVVVVVIDDPLLVADVGARPPVPPTSLDDPVVLDDARPPVPAVPPVGSPVEMPKMALQAESSPPQKASTGTARRPSEGDFGPEAEARMMAAAYTVQVRLPRESKKRKCSGDQAAAKGASGGPGERQSTIAIAL
jgi:hypothetical protein